LRNDFELLSQEELPLRLANLVLGLLLDLLPALAEADRFSNQPDRHLEALDRVDRLEDLLLSLQLEVQMVWPPVREVPAQ